LRIAVFAFWKGDGNTKSPKLNSSKHSTNCIYIYLRHVRNFDPLQFFPHIGLGEHFCVATFFVVKIRFCSAVWWRVWNT